MSFQRSLISVGIGALLAISIASPSFAYGKENWQITFAGTGTQPSAGNFGFWGWCTLGGGVTAGNNGDCQFAEYVHGALGTTDFTCQESLDISSWQIGAGVFPMGDFLLSGTATVHNASLSQAQQAACLGIFPGGTSFSGADSQLPGAAGHYNLSSLVPVLFGTTQGEFQIQVTQIP